MVGYSLLLKAESTPGRIDYVSSKDTIGNLTRDLVACSAVPQTTTPSRTPVTNRAELSVDCIIVQSLNLSLI
jgi:hypothetical protein